MDSRFGTDIDVLKAAKLLRNPYANGSEPDDTDVQGISDFSKHEFLQLVQDIKSVRRIPYLGEELDTLRDSKGYLHHPEKEIAKFKDALFLHVHEGLSLPSSSSLQSIKSCDTDNGCVSDDGLSSTQRQPFNQIMSLHLTLGDINQPATHDNGSISKSTSCDILLSPTTLNGPCLNRSSSPISMFDENLHDEMEKRLVLDVLLVCQGLIGSIIQYDEHKNFVLASEPDRIHPAQRAMVLRLCPISKSYKAIKEKLAKVSKGKCKDALKYAVFKQLQDFDEMILNLEERAKIGSLGGEKDSRSSSQATTDHLTLHRLECLLFNSKKLLNAILVMLTRIAEQEDSVHICTTLHEFTSHGDPEIQNLAFKTLAIVCKPIFSMVGDWIFTGSFVDEFDEFFVKVDHSCLPENMWRSKFTLMNKKVPSFISSVQSKLIFRAGKNINFLVDICKATDVYFGHAKLSKLFRDLDVEDALRDTVTLFPDVIKTAFTVTSERVLQEVITNENLFEHLHAIKYYLLQGQGDFFQYFVRQIRDQLLQPAKSVNNQHLQETLQYSLNACTHLALRDFKERVYVTRAPRSEMLALWDVFCLAYRTNTCISQVITKDCMEVYSRVFSFLWQSLRVESCMKSMWISKKTFTKEILKIVPEIRIITLHCNLLIGEFNNFIVQVRYYAMSEAVESEWQTLMNKLATMTCIEDMIAQHDNFIQIINIRCLQSRHATRILLLLESVYAQILSMEKYFNSFCNRVTRESNRRMNIADGTSTTSAEFNHVVLLDFHKYLEEASSKISELQKSSRKYIQTFLLAAETYKDPKFPCIDLSGLCYRVDFNNFYAENCAELARTKTLKHRLSEDSLLMSQSLTGSVTI